MKIDRVISVGPDAWVEAVAGVSTAIVLTRNFELVRAVVAREAPPPEATTYLRIRRLGLVTNIQPLQHLYLRANGAQPIEVGVVADNAISQVEVFRSNAFRRLGAGPVSISTPQNTPAIDGGRPWTSYAGLDVFDAGGPGDQMATSLDASLDGQNP